MSFRIGEVAQASGLTVRTLHHYEQIGLLKPASRTEAGHRLYDDADLERLYRILAFRQLGLPLRDIANALDDPTWDMRTTMSSQLADVERRISTAMGLRTRLLRLLDATGPVDTEPTSDELLGLLEETAIMDTTVQQRITYLVYRDLEAMFGWLQQVFELDPGQLHRDDNDQVIHAELHAGDGLIWLHRETEQFGLASPASLGSATAGVAVIVDDVDAHHAHTRDHGADIVYPPIDQPYGYREYSARDPERGIWSFMQPNND